MIKFYNIRPLKIFYQIRRKAANIFVYYKTNGSFKSNKIFGRKSVYEIKFML